MNITKRCRCITKILLLLLFTVISCNDKVFALDKDSDSVVPKVMYHNSKEYNNDISENDGELDYEYLYNKMIDLEKIIISITENDKYKNTNTLIYNDMVDVQREISKERKRIIKFTMDKKVGIKKHKISVKDLRNNSKFEEKISKLIRIIHKNDFIISFINLIDDMKKEKNLIKIKRKKEKLFDIQNRPRSEIIYYYNYYKIIITEY
ncbi:hypothetical protein [Blattabacterium cuenoti]|uniref:hypothetical protein n=1 Tax=Blattabacterium cuenoti TaxID=1653831 RepID=UPI00163CBAB0|nr:hypothetical protein [Blattabacterium cuenoti]